MRLANEEGDTIVKTRDNQGGNTLLSSFRRTGVADVGEVGDVGDVVEVGDVREVGDVVE
ncbi:unnamed protein product, partial [Staurois parvus]